MQLLMKATDSISRLLMIFSIIFAGAMMLHVTLDVILSQFIAEPLPGTVEIVSGYYMVALVFLPLAFVELKNEHIHVDVLYSHIPDRGKTILDIFALALSTVYLSLMTYRTWLDALEKFEVGEYSMGMFSVALWPGRFFVPIGCAVLTVALLLKLIRRPFTDADMQSEPSDMTAGGTT
ncbi:MAG: TRAP transporter small permease [Rhodobacteraceae bacterium]|nr:TRAP transporter small permease [Paracoccaceae bacterium]